MYGALAQLGERLLCTQEVNGSIPLSSTIFLGRRSSVGLEHSVHTRGVRGSSPFVATNLPVPRLYRALFFMLKYDKQRRIYESN